MLWRRSFSWVVSFTLLLSFPPTSASPVFALKTQSTAEKTTGLEELGKKLQGKTPPNDAGDYLIDGTSTTPAQPPPTKQVDPARVIRPPMPSDASFDLDPGYREAATSGLEEKYRPAVVIPAPPGGAEGSGGSTRLVVAVPPSRAARSAGAEMSAPNLPASAGNLPASSPSALPSVRSELVEERTDRPSTGEGAADLETSDRPPAVTSTLAAPARTGSTIPAASTAVPIQPPARPDDRPFKPFFLPANSPEPTFLPPTGSEFSSRPPAAPAVPSVSPPPTVRAEPFGSAQDRLVEARTPSLTLAGLEETWNRAGADKWVILRGGSAGRELVDLLPAGAQVADLGSSFWLNRTVPLLTPGMVWNILQVQPEGYLVAIAPSGPVALLREGELSVSTDEQGRKGTELYQQAAARARKVLLEADLKQIGLAPGIILGLGELFKRDDTLVSQVTGKVSFKVTADQTSAGDAVTLRPIGKDESARKSPAADLRVLYRVVRPTVSIAGLEEDLLLSHAELLGVVETFSEKVSHFGNYVIGRFTHWPNYSRTSLNPPVEVGAESDTGRLSMAQVRAAVDRIPETKTIAWLEALRTGIRPLQIQSAPLTEGLTLDSHGLRLPNRARLGEIHPRDVLAYLSEFMTDPISVRWNGREISFKEYEALRKELAEGSESLPLLLLLDKEGRVHPTPAYWVSESGSEARGAFWAEVESEEYPTSREASSFSRSIVLKRSETDRAPLETALRFVSGNPVRLLGLSGQPFSVASDGHRVVYFSESAKPLAQAVAKSKGIDTVVSALNDLHLRVSIETPEEVQRSGNRLLLLIQESARAGLEEVSAPAAARPAVSVPAARPETVSPSATVPVGAIGSSYTGTAPAGGLTRAPEAPAVTSTVQQAKPALIVSTAVFSAALQILSPEMRQPDGRSIPVMTVVESPGWIPAVYAQAEQVGLELTQVVSLTEFGGNMDAALNDLRKESIRQGFEPVVARRIADLAGLEEVLGVARPETFRRVVEALIEAGLEQYP